MRFYIFCLLFLVYYEDEDAVASFLLMFTGVAEESGSNIIFVFPVVLS